MNIKLRCSLILLCVLVISVYGSDIEKDSISSLSQKTTTYNTLTSKQQLSLDLLDEKFPIAISNQSSFTEPEFTYDRIRSEFPVENRILEDRQRAAAMFQDIETQGNWVDSFSNEDIQTLPLGMKYTQDEGGTDIEIGLMSAVVSTQYISFTAFMRLTLEQTDDTGERIQLFFGANDLKISHQGGIVGDANLVLMGDVNVPFDNGSWLISFKGGFNYATGVTDAITYANIDCDGLNEIGVTAEVQFSRDKVLPASLDGKLLPATRSYRASDGTTKQIPNRVTGAFSVVVSDWNDMLTEISLSPFVLTKSPDKFLFAVNRAVLDFSDIRTENVQFPQFYHDNGLLAPSQES